LIVSSKFRIWAAFPIFFIIISLLLIILPILNGDALFKKAISFAIIVYIITGAAIIYSVIELRRIADVNILDLSITTGEFMGFGYRHTYNYDEINGYKISMINPARGGPYEYLFLIKDDKKVVRITERHHKNYQKLKETLIEKNIKNLGEEKLSYLRQLFY
jgi:hypothetical protein